MAVSMPHGNMVREVREETGLDISGARRGERHYALSTERGTVIFRRYFLDATADEIASRIRDFVAGESEPEIEGPVIIRNARRPARRADAAHAADDRLAFSEAAEA